MTSSGGPTIITPADFGRGGQPVELDLSSGCRLPASGRPPWISRGGAKGHPFRTHSATLEVPLPRGVRRVHVLGVFALFGEADAPGTVGGSLTVQADGELVVHVELVAGEHYGGAAGDGPLGGHGDGTRLHTLGRATIAGQECRLDVLSVDCATEEPGILRLRQCDAHASFVVCDVFVEHLKAHGCPFHENGGGIPLSDLSAIVRLRDRPRLLKAIAQLDAGVRAADDLDEAKGQALTFLAVVTAALLELGGGRELHRTQLHATREVDAAGDPAAVAETIRKWIDLTAEDILREPEGPSTYLVDKALQIVDRNYARPLTDELVAHQLGLSTSHFRFLFKSAVGVPFHRYLVNMRLEKAHAMLVDGTRSVSEVAGAVGFQGLSHFSRAFSARFSTPPTQVRRAVAKG